MWSQSLLVTGVTAISLFSSSTMAQAPQAGIQMQASEMLMAFFNSEYTPLYSKGWAPAGKGGYAGTCIFLILLTIIYRSLFAFKDILEARWAHQAYNRRFVVVADRQSFSEQAKIDPDLKTAVLTANGVDENVKIVTRSVKMTPPWRFSVDLPRAAFVTLMVGIGYLL
jgi:copper transporter 1